MVNDPIADMLMRIRNAGAAGKVTTEVPYSSLALRIANVLLKEGFIASVERESKKAITKERMMTVGIKYDAPRDPRVKGLERVSKPSRRVYSGVAKLRSVHQGHGLVILSTPKGILTDTDARKEHVGGEVICKVW